MEIDISRVSSVSSVKGTSPVATKPAKSERGMQGPLSEPGRHQETVTTSEEGVRRATDATGPSWRTAPREYPPPPGFPENIAKKLEEIRQDETVSRQDYFMLEASLVMDTVHGTLVREPVNFLDGRFDFQSYISDLIQANELAIDKGPKEYVHNRKRQIELLSRFVAK